MREKENVNDLTLKKKKKNGREAVFYSFPRPKKGVG
jgi:hypothetical protein